MIATALIEKGKDGKFGIFTSDINSVIIGEGNTVEEAKADFENSVKEMIASYLEEGDELPEELRDIEFVFKYDLASMLNYYNWINVSKFAKKAGINASLMRQYKTGKTYISDTQIGKIEHVMHQLGQELVAIKL